MDKIILMILDGFGYREEKEANAYRLAKAPHLDKLFKEYPGSLLHCHGRYVGLPDGVMGNSEVGHMNIGSGRIVKQELVRINDEIESGEFFSNDVLQDTLSYCREAGKVLHLFGLLSDGGVHSHIEHIFAILKAAREAKMRDVYLHAFMDGRDTSPTAGINYIRQFEKRAAEIGVGRIASVSGRYYAMDRDKRWERTEKAYKTLVFGEGEKSGSAEEAVLNSYRNNITDEFIIPTVIMNKANGYITVKGEDAVLAFNFRADRMRQITRAFTEVNFREFETLPAKPHYTSMTQYDENFRFPVLYPPVQLKNILGEIISKHGMKQLRIAETEKYAHVTYFFNGGEEKRFDGEDRVLIQSPKVATYDLQPEMSAREVTDKMCDALDSGKYNLIVLNFANGDMVGHTGSLPAAIKAIETLDGCVWRIYNKSLERGYVILLTADHGNSEMMVDPQTGEPHTAHTLNPVPFYIINYPKIREVKPGILADIAPTILKMMNIEQPPEMDGTPLI